MTDFNLHINYLQDANAIIGQRVAMSDKDAAKLKAMYGCK